MKITQKFAFFIASLIVFMPQIISANEALHDSYSFPGGVAEIILQKKTEDLPEVKFGIVEPVIIEESDHWRILIGISLDTLPGEYLVYVKRALKEETAVHHSFFVKQNSYSLSEESLQNKIELTHKQLSKLEFENTQQPSLPLQKPVTGVWNESFGQLNFDSNKNRLIRQNLVYFETKQIKNISAPQNGIISNIETLEDGTSTIYLDHGRGLYSVISGLDQLTVEIGNGVVAGAVIARIWPQNDDTSKQKTKRITWQCIMNGTIVNPVILTQL